MILLTIRTDKPEAEIGLYDNSERIDYEIWTAHRQLAETLLTKINQLLERNNRALSDVRGIVCYQGPGSFTGLRIGLSVGNALAYGLRVPAAGSTGEEWAKEGIEKLLNGQKDFLVLPEYGADVHITLPKH